MLAEAAERERQLDAAHREARRASAPSQYLAR